MASTAGRRMTLPSIYESESGRTNRLRLIENKNSNDELTLYDALQNFFQNQFPSHNFLLNENYLSTIRSIGYFRPTWIEIDIGAVCSNIRLLKNYLGDQVHLMAVVKANAYGYGMLQIASAAISSGATWLGVATLDEGLSIRYHISKTIPILVLGYVKPEHLSIASKYKITVTCISLEWIEQATKYISQSFDFHLKIDTGLNRLGLKTIDELKIVLNIINSNPNLNCTGIFTHFATSGDMDDKTYFNKQLQNFNEFLRVIPNIQNKIIHCANSDAALCQLEKPFFNMVRLGKSMFSPPPEYLNRFMPFQLKYTLSLHSSLGLVKKLNPDEKIGYSGEYTTTTTEWIATVPIGYADGWHQQFKKTNVLIDGIRVPVVGRIAMDQLSICLPKYYPTGTKVTFIGQQGNQNITPYEISINANQPEAEVLTSLANRLPRIYINNGSVVSIQNSILD